MAEKDDMIELGSSGLRRTSGFVIDDFVTGLQGQKGAKVWREMSDNDPIIGAMMFAIERLILEIGWDVEPFTDATDTEVTPEAEANAQFVEECMADMSESWSTTLQQILSFLVYGFAPCEIVYKRRNGMDQKDGSRRSKYNDGKIGWRKVALRAQETVWSWQFDETGSIEGVNQMDPYVHKGVVFIPIEKLLLFRTVSARSNPEGRSILRNAYRPWKFKRTIEEIEAVGIERDLAGLPVAYVPPTMLSSTATPQEVSARNAIQTMIRGIKRNENEGILFPLAYDAQGRETYKLELLSSGGSRQFNTDAIVARYDQRISMVVLADFILLGHENVGSFALGTSKIDLFTTAIQQICNSIAEVFNDHALPRLFKLNGMDTSKLPQIKPQQIAHVDLPMLGDFISKMVQAGAITVDSGLDEYLRELTNLPKKVEGEEGVPEDQLSAEEMDTDETDEEAAPEGAADTEEGESVPMKPEANQEPTGAVRQPKK
ncbi:hypothetical protein UFOVP471_86 [uncultured Caudovirales phage]|uniref:Portal protein n=1 Tax=uncultured Caudovirales phage TaxID=2100421 RepID=A0A6J5MCW9_9CAUD|nr:hypothetical protein UFOVP471_86 [uncultured Caudovirales phage]